jgi:hypothetical protein
MDELAIGIELDVSGIDDVAWAAAAEDGPDDEQAAAASASAATPTAPRNVEPGRERPVRADLDMDKPPQVPGPADGHRRRRLR